MNQKKKGEGGLGISPCSAAPTSRTRWRIEVYSVESLFYLFG